MEKLKQIMLKAKKFNKEHKKGVIAAVVIMICVCLLGMFLFKENVLEQSSITVLDVGKGNCTFIKSGNEYIVYDAGYDEEHETTIDDYIRTYEIDNISTLILSHNDKYNINGAVSLMKKFDIDRIYMSSYGGNSNAYKELLEYIDSHDIDVINPAQGDKIVLFDGVITFVQPDNIQFVDNDDASLCIQYLDSRSNRTFMTGGASSVVEKEILKYVKKQDSKLDEDELFYTKNYLILGKNGSDKASCKEWIQYMNPEFILVSTTNEKLSDRLEQLFAQLGKIYTSTATSSTMELVFNNQGCSMSSMSIPTEQESLKTEEEAQEYADNLRKSEIESHPYVGNRNTYIYYDHDNPIVETIMDSYITYFNSAEQAEENGFTYSK